LNGQINRICQAGLVSHLTSDQNKTLINELLIIDKPRVVMFQNNKLFVR